MKIIKILVLCTCFFLNTINYNSCQNKIDQLSINNSNLIDYKTTNNINNKIDGLSDETYNNKFFFKDGVTSVTYKGYLMFWNQFDQSLTLNINKVASFKSGDIYLLKLNQIESLEPFDKIPESRLILGYFYVTKDKIYKVNNYDKSITEEFFIKEGQLVCQEDELRDTLEEYVQGWHEFIEVDGDKRKFRSYNNLVDTGFYERIVWEKGNGHILSLKSEESYELNNENNVIKDSTELMLSSIKSKDLNEFKSILCDEFYIIRYLSGGRGIRGKTIKFLYSKNEAPEDFMVDVDKETPIDFTKMFKENVIGEKDIEIIDSNFNIPDEVTIISEYVSQIQEIITKNISIAVEDETKIIKCSNGFLLINLKGILKDEVTEIVLGSIAIFLKVNDQYYVRCLISML